MLKDVKIPEISENVTEGTVVAVHVKKGDAVAVDDVLVEMETDKAVVEIPSPYAGSVEEVLVAEGDRKNVGDVIARIETAGDGEAQEEKESEPKETAGTEKTAEPGGQKEAEAVEEPRPAEETPRRQATKGSDQGPETVSEASGQAAADTAPPHEERPQPAPAAPSVRRFARELGVDINAVDGSGPGGRITQQDVSTHVKQRMTAEKPPTSVSSSAGQPALPDFSRWGGVHTESLETVRRLTAENTSLSWRLIPHVTQFDEADITDIQPFIERHGKRAEKQGGKLTLTAVVMKLCAEALVRFPQFNASIDIDRQVLIYKDYVHIGMAVDTPRGLLVPVIRDVQKKGIIDLAVEIADVARRARDKKVKPDEFEGGTFTISNQGGIGGVGFTPVVVWPQAAILGISRARRMPVEKDGAFVPRSILPLALSYDHRIIDGADAARFLDWICACLQQGLTILL